MAAYDLYIRGVQASDSATGSSRDVKEVLSEAINLFEQAIAHDPSFFNVYCSLAQAHDRFYLFGGDHTAQRLALAERAVNAALQLQPDAPEAHLTRADYLYTKLDYDGARAEIDIVRRTLPNDPRALELSGYIDRRQGRWADSARNLQRALELDPQNVFLLQQIAINYRVLRKYADSAAALDRAIVLKPDDLDARIDRAQLEIIWKAHPAPLHELIASTLRENRRSPADLAGIRIFLALVERNANEGGRAAADLGENTFGPDAFHFPAAYFAGIFARLRGDEAAARTSFEQARAIQEEVIAAQPDHGPAICILGLIDAGLGRKEDAIREGRRAGELMPVTKDAINGVHLLNNLAMIYAWTGEKDLAIDQLRRALQYPGSLAYGNLRLFPNWDPLRGDPRFEQIIESLAPKESAGISK